MALRASPLLAGVATGVRRVTFIREASTVGQHPPPGKQGTGSESHPYLGNDAVAATAGAFITTKQGLFAMNHRCFAIDKGSLAANEGSFVANNGLFHAEQSIVHGKQRIVGRKQWIVRRKQWKVYGKQPRIRDEK